jgi:hypothetical protein
MMTLFTFDPLAFFTVALLVIGINILWYAPFAFGRFWLETQRNLSQSPPNTGQGVLLLMGTQLFALLVINGLENGLGIHNFTEGVMLGLVCGLGLVGSFTLSNAFFFGIPLKLWALDLTHQLWVIALAAGILAVLH